MQHCTRMRIERNHRRHRADGVRPVNNGSHDQLVSKVQSIKHAEREHCRPLNFRVVSSVKETHKGKWQSFDHQSVVSKLDACGQFR